MAGSWNDAPGGHKSYLKTAEGHRIELLPNRVYVLGRDAQCDIKIEDPECSRRHARISISGDVRIAHVQDMGSKNGTLRNDRAVKGRAQLESGDKIRMGNTTYEVHLGVTAADFELDTRTRLGDF